MSRRYAIALVIAGVIAYANSFTNPFVFDDNDAILNNPTIRSLTASDALNPPKQTAVAGRPIVNLSLAINYAIGGTSPLGYHAFNLAVHIACALLLFGVVRRTLTRIRGPESRLANPESRVANPESRIPNPDKADALAFASALLWLVHPLQTEVVDYVTQRTESMMALFFLFTLYAAIRGWLWVAVCACALGMACKESMVTAPVMVFLYGLAFGFDGGHRPAGPDKVRPTDRPDKVRPTRPAGPHKVRPTKNGADKVRPTTNRPGRFYFALAATWVVLAALIVAGPRSHSAGYSSGMSPWTYLINQPRVIVRYLTLAFWPRGLVLDYGPPWNVSLTDVWPYALIVIVLLAATALLWRRHRPLAFLGTWFFVTLAPSSSIIPIATEVGAERRMYLPLAAVIVAVVIAAWALVLHHRARLISATALAVACCLLAVLTLQRNAEYHTGIGIWQTVVDRRPHGRAFVNLGLELKALGHRDEAMKYYERSIADDPEGHYALGFEYGVEGKYTEAEKHLREYVRLRPDDLNVIRAYNLLGQSLVAQSRKGEAADAFRQVLRMDRRNVDARNSLASLMTAQGLAFVEQDRNEDALREFQAAAELTPANPAMHHNLGNALAAVGRLEEAVAEYRRALELNPNHPQTRENLSEVLAVLSGQRPR